MPEQQPNPPVVEVWMGRLAIGLVITFVVGGVMLALISWIASSFQSVVKDALSANNGLVAREAALYIASWVILLVISWLATLQVREVLRSRPNDPFRTRANYIAVIIGLVFTIFLFKQPLLERIFADQTSGGVLKSILFGGGVTVGWVVWYLRQLKKYGEFFHVLLFTVIIGFCWYARLTAPEEIQITAVAFLLGSLSRLAKDYLDEASKHTPEPA
jgi:hypothetical protein